MADCFTQAARIAAAAPGGQQAACFVENDETSGSGAVTPQFGHKARDDFAPVIASKPARRLDLDIGQQAQCRQATAIAASGSGSPAKARCWRTPASSRAQNGIGRRADLPDAVVVRSSVSSWISHGEPSADSMTSNSTARQPLRCRHVQPGQGVLRRQHATAAMCKTRGKSPVQPHGRANQPPCGAATVPTVRPFSARLAAPDCHVPPRYPALPLQVFCRPRPLPVLRRR